MLLLNENAPSELLKIRITKLEKLQLLSCISDTVQEGRHGLHFIDREDFS